MSFTARIRALPDAIEGMTSFRGRMLCRELHRAGKPMRRDDVMAHTQFPSSREHPVCAYVSFTLEVMRANEDLRRIGITIANDAAERYWLQELPKN